ncbi:toll-interacting protein-like isoform X2 [Sitodiplosis mosellana]|uniref:toll-interacting protein-like isoform X2 n=1 Tax=Sitodiplosis mosellana TaxID=263140 RepID=UPI002443F9BF|nr:toll-interacting protein-like isoform X2 [Sitodiplosis mosellana]
MSAQAQGWQRAMIGPLPAGFLRLTTEREIQESADRQAAIALYQQQNVSYMPASNIVGRLSITVAQAKLVRNYGLTRMDPYARVRVGHFVYETQTDPNGGKTPRWNRVIHSQLPSGVNTIFVEIYDECSFKMDELIAWTEVKIPESVLRGETHEEWYSLSGKQGDHVEGMIDVVMSFTPASAMASYNCAAVPPVVMVPNVSGGQPLPVFVTPQPQIRQPAVEQPVPVQPITDDDVKQVKEMFPNVDDEVIRSVLEVNRGNKQSTINSLLQMTEQ